jgi:hypothetical protein
MDENVGFNCVEDESLNGNRAWNGSILEVGGAQSLSVLSHDSGG